MIPENFDDCVYPVIYNEPLFIDLPSISKVLKFVPIYNRAYIKKDITSSASDLLLLEMIFGELPEIRKHHVTTLDGVGIICDLSEVASNMLFSRHVKKDSQQYLSFGNTFVLSEFSADIDPDNKLFLPTSYSYRDGILLVNHLACSVENMITRRYTQSLHTCCTIYYGNIMELVFYYNSSNGYYSIMGKFNGKDVCIYQANDRNNMKMFTKTIRSLFIKMMYERKINEEIQ